MDQLDIADESTLLDLIDKFEFIWDKKHKMYKDIIAVENAWMSISKVMSINGKVV